jgi:hypothetical protein
MQLLQEAGIYVMVLLNGRHSDGYILDGEAKGDWDYQYSESIYRLIDGFQKYPNTLGFVFGTRGQNFALPTIYRKTDVRDMKEYIKNMQYRHIPVGIMGFCHRKGAFLDFLNCGDKDGSIDFYEMGLPFPPLGGCETRPTFYDGMVEDYRNSSIPLLIDYGHPVSEKANFAEIHDLFSASMIEVFSGGILYCWYPSSYLSVDLGEFAQGCY